jgi:phage shock protein PspC (stress-responsive transcriptional regulator)
MEGESASKMDFGWIVIPLYFFKEVIFPFSLRTLLYITCAFCMPYQYYMGSGSL